MASDPNNPPAEQLVEMTIRSQPPCSSHPPTEGIPSPPADSPPVIAVDEDEDEEDDIEDAMGDYNTDFIHIDNEEDYFRKFPFATPAYHGDYKAALRQMISHFQGGKRFLLPGGQTYPSVKMLP
jgi:ubiquitin carboxyl-terminal hydrolase 34